MHVTLLLYVIYIKNINYDFYECHLTAAHCVYQKTEQPELISVGYAGDSDLVQMYFQSQTPVAEVHVHPDHVRIQNTSLHDLALLKLNYPIQFNDKVSPACLNPSMARAYSCEQTVPLVATGYGVQSIPETENAGMNSRRAKRLDMMDKSKIAYSCIQRPELLCAVSLTGSTCFGDSGSPLHHIKQGMQIVRLFSIKTSKSIINKHIETLIHNRAHHCDRNFIFICIERQTL